MIKAKTGTKVRFPYKGKTITRELVGIIEISYDYWIGDLGMSDDERYLYDIYGEPSNGVPVWHNLSVRVIDHQDVTKNIVITEGIFVEL